VKSGGPSVGKVGEWYVESQHLQGCSPRPCQLRTNGLAPMSKYWTYRLHVSDMSPVSLVACYQQRLAYPHNFKGCLGRETGYGPMDWSAGVLWIVSGSLFHRSSDSVHLYWQLHKRLLCIDRVRYVWSGTIHRLGVGCMWRVGRVSPVGCTLIQIAAALGHE
jgi:hypothetical protein